METFDQIHARLFLHRRHISVVYSEPPDKSIVRTIIQKQVSDLSGKDLIPSDLAPSDMMVALRGFFAIQIVELQIICRKDIEPDEVKSYVAAEEVRGAGPHPNEAFYLNGAGQKKVVKHLVLKLVKRSRRMLQNIEWNGNVFNMFDCRKGERIVLAYIGKEAL